MLESFGDLPSKIPLLITTVQQCNDLKEILTKILNEFQNTRNDLNVINRNFEKTNIEDISTTIIENMAHLTNHQEKLSSFNKQLKNSIAFLWKLFTPPPPKNNFNNFNISLLYTTAFNKMNLQKSVQTATKISS